jgi:excisionase family DNA binding protein
VRIGWALSLLFLEVNMEKAETKFFLTSEAARELDLSAGTIRTWEKEGKIRAERSGAGFRIFLEEELLRFKRAQGSRAQMTRLAGQLLWLLRGGCGGNRIRKEQNG